MRDTAKAASPYAMPINDFVISVTGRVAVAAEGGAAVEFVRVLLRHNCHCNLRPSVSALELRRGEIEREREGRNERGVEAEDSSRVMMRLCD